MSQGGLRWPRVNSAVEFVPSVLDDLEDVNVVAPADGDVVTWNAAANEWIPSASGGGGGAALPFPLPPPASPSAYDDEFTAGSLDAKWTETNTPNGSFTKFASKFGTWWGMEGTGNATFRYVIRQALTGFGAGTAFQVTLKCSIGWKNGPSGDPRIGVGLGDSATFDAGNRTLWYVSQSSGTLVVHEYNGGLNLNQGTGITQLGVTVYLHIQRTTGDVIRWYMSADGISWVLSGSATRSFAFDYLFLWADGSTSSGNPSRTLIDFVRVNDADFLQPI